MSREGLALAAAAATGIQVGAAMVATRLVVSDLGPASIALLRYAIAAVCVAPLALRGARAWPTGRDLLAVLALGAGQFGILIALLNLGLLFLDATRAATIFAAFPLLTMLLSVSLGREAGGARKAGGVLLTMAGVGIALGEATPRAGEALWLGAGLILASATVGAVCAVFSRPYLERYPTIRVSFVAMLGAVVALAPAAAIETGSGRWSGPGPAGWLAVLFIGLSSGIGYFLWLWALKHTTPTRVTVFLALSPVTAALLGAAIWGEPLSAGTAAGIAAVAAGLWLAVGPRGTRALPQRFSL